MLHQNSLLRPRSARSCQGSGPCVPKARTCIPSRHRSVTHASSLEYLKCIKEQTDAAESLKKNLFISDVVSSDGPSSELQWVDLVLAGGGLLGIAHVGFVCILEKAGVRFRGIGGTSAGAINASIIAAVRGNPAAESWEKTLEILQGTDFATFQDGEGVKNINALLKAALGGNGGNGSGRVISLGNAPQLVGAAWELKGVWSRRGIHPGDAFQDWVRKLLKENDITTVAQLEDKMAIDKSLGLHIRPERDSTTGPGKGPFEARMATDINDITTASLKLVTSDVVTQTKVILPEMAQLYHKDPSMADPSAFVRASMSVPLFFTPYEITGIPKNDPKVQKAWDDTGYPTDAIPDKATFVDGGTLSNFPISLFDQPGEPYLPTLGCQLGVPRGEAQTADNPFQLYKAMNNTSRHIGDYEFVNKNPIYKTLVATVDTTGFGWLDFTMSDENKKKLFREGAIAGVNLLARFQRTSGKGGDDNWTKIKKLRKPRP